MMRRVICATWIILMGFAGSAIGQEAPSPAIGHIFNDIRAMQRRPLSDRDKGEDMRQAYLAKVGPYRRAAALQSLSTDDVRVLLRTAFTTVFFSFDRQFADDERLFLAELERRRAATREDYETVVKGYTTVRDMANARQYAPKAGLNVADYPDIKPTTIPKGGSTVIEPAVDDQGNLTRTLFTVAGPGLKVVVVSDSMCHFSSAAATAFDQLPLLKSEMAEHSLWVVPPQGRLELSETHKWNADHPSEHMVMMYALSEWAAIDTTETPTFYIFRNGVLQKKIVGWRGQETEDALIAAMKG